MLSIKQLMIMRLIMSFHRKCKLTLQYCAINALNSSCIFKFLVSSAISAISSIFLHKNFNSPTFLTFDTLIFSFWVLLTQLTVVFHIYVRRLSAKLITLLSGGEKFNLTSLSNENNLKNKFNLRKFPLFSLSASQHRNERDFAQTFHPTFSGGSEREKISRRIMMVSW